MTDHENTSGIDINEVNVIDLDNNNDVEIKTPKQKSKGGFFPFFNKSTKVIKQSSAGAGFVGLIGFAVMIAIASVFFIIVKKLYRECFCSTWNFYTLAPRGTIFPYILIIH